MKLGAADDRFYDMTTHNVLLYVIVLSRVSQGAQPTVCDGQTLTISCHNGHVIVIESAVYGRTTREVCGAGDMTNCSAVVLPQVQKACFRKHSCVIDVQPPMITPEPCPNVEKYLNLTYECLNEDKIHTIGKETNIRDSWGYLVSPNYPHDYDNDIFYQTDFSESNTSVRLLDLDMESRATTGCYDWLIMSDSKHVRHTYDYCGTLETAKEPLRQTLSNFHISFRVDGANPKRGFLIKFRVVSASGAVVGILRTTTGLINGAVQVQQLFVVFSIIGLIWFLRKINCCSSVMTWLTGQTRRTKLI